MAVDQRGDASRERSGFVERAAARLAAALLAACLAACGATEAPREGGTNVVLGDSNSTPRTDDWQAWPELLFGDDYVNKARGGLSTHQVVDACTEPCWWIDRTDENDVWWIMLGTNDLVVDPASSPERYEANLRAIIARIPAREIRIVTSPRVYAAEDDPRNVFLDAQAVVDRRICASDDRVTCAGDLGEVLSLRAHYRDSVHLNQAGQHAAAEMLSRR